MVKVFMTKTCVKFAWTQLSTAFYLNVDILSRVQNVDANWLNVLFADDWYLALFTFSRPNLQFVMQYPSAWTNFECFVF